jgi:hypothetical protein
MPHGIPEKPAPMHTTLIGRTSLIALSRSGSVHEAMVKLDDAQVVRIEAVDSYCIVFSLEHPCGEGEDIALSVALDTYYRCFLSKGLDKLYDTPCMTAAHPRICVDNQSAP